MLKNAPENEKELFWVPEDNISKEVIVPYMSEAKYLDIMSGYFTVESFKDLGEGLVSYINNTESPVRLLINTSIGEEEYKLLLEDNYIEDEILKKIIETFTLAKDSENLVVRHTFDCLTYLIQEKRLITKIVFMKKGIYHTKCWIFGDGLDKVVLSGSANVTENGLKNNFEQLRVDKSWTSDTSKKTCDQFMSKFNEIWEDKLTYSRTVKIPDESLKKILGTHMNRSAPTLNDYLNAKEKEKIKEMEPYIPSGIKWENGKYSHQKSAVDSWFENNCKGVFAIATGGGKTKTSIICSILLKRKMPDLGLAVIVAVPSVILQKQWVSEIEQFNAKPYLADSESSTAEEHISKIDKDLTLLENELKFYVITHNLLKNKRLIKILNSEKNKNRVMVIGDEVHGLGVPAFTKKNLNVKYLLGLSATPNRFEEDETKEITKIFGETVSEFSIREAIVKGCLVPYTYKVLYTKLTIEEYNEYCDLKHRANSISKYDENGEVNSKKALILAKQQGVIEQCYGKYEVFENYLSTLVYNNDTKNVKHTLIFCSSKAQNSTTNSRQIDMISDILRNKFPSIKFHDITSYETANGTAAKIISEFKSGEIDLLKSMKVLDEGFDIPQIKSAILMANSKSNREWVQRRGRILRNYSNNSFVKDKALLVDIVVLPPDESRNEKEALELIGSELARVDEFWNDSIEGFNGGSDTTIQWLKNNYLYQNFREATYE
jgi:superfamily II DNA or RNA helicase